MAHDFRTMVGIIMIAVIFVVALVINICKARQNKGKPPSKEKPQPRGASLLGPHIPSLILQEFACKNLQPLRHCSI